MTFRALVPIALVTTALVACDSEPADGRDEVCTTFAASLVDHAARCYFPRGTPPYERERADIARYCRATLDIPGLPLDFAQQVSACGAQLTSSPCPRAGGREFFVNKDSTRGEAADVDWALRECGVTKGTLADGAACRFGFQCASGECFGSNIAVCGTCRSPVALGGDCFGGPCVAGAQCRVSETSATERKAECVPVLGQEKVPNAAGGPCGVHADCESGLACREGTCVARFAEGSVCTFFGGGDPCARGLRCGADKTCTPVRSRSAGEPCVSALDCRRGTCRLETPGELTPGANTCSPDLLEGAPCGNDGRQCAVDLGCYNGKCSRIAPPLQPLACK